MNIKIKIIEPTKKFLAEGNEDEIEIGVQWMEKHGIPSSLKELIDDTALRIVGNSERSDDLAERLWTLLYEEETELQKGAE